MTKTPWHGKHMDLQENREPNAFLGIPLKFMDRVSRQERVIGVLKLEDRLVERPHPPAIFTDEDVRLGEMMANIIATVLYNTQVSSAQIQKLSSNLEQLSKALAGGQEMRHLVDQVVETTAWVLGAEASSLYLIDEATNELVIQAATGYQRPLVAHRATYKVGEGITGWIALKGEPFRANNLDELHKHEAWKGKQNPGQNAREPRSFLGLPLKVVDRFTRAERVIGVLKVEDIVPSNEHPQEYFTSQDVLLVTMMANVIATVIHNTRQGEAGIGNILRRMGTLSNPVNITLELLHEFARRDDWGIIDQLAIAVVSALDEAPEREMIEIKALFEAKAHIDLYRRIASRTQSDDLKWLFALFYNILKANSRFESWSQVQNAAEAWLQLKRCSNSQALFAQAARELAGKIANVLSVEAISTHNDATWSGTVLNTERIFGTQNDRIPLLFQRQGQLDQDHLDRLFTFAQQQLVPRSQDRVLLVVLSGEQTLRDALTSSLSPLFNFVNELLIGRLDFGAVGVLVTEPLKQLEIELVDTEIVRRIYELTSGHPNVVQRLCRRLIERLNALNSRRITLNDVEAVIEDPGFQREDFLGTYWERATVLEQIISLLMANDQQVRTLRAVRQALAQHCNLRPKAREVDEALQRLVDLRSILKQTPAGYEFAVEAFPRIVNGTTTLSDMLDILTEEYQESQVEEPPVR